MSIFIWVLVIFSFAPNMALASLERPPPGVVSTFKALGIEKTLEIMVRELEKNNGKSLDQATTQLSVSANGRNLNTTMQAQLDKGRVDAKSLRAELVKKVEAMACTAPINVMLITDMGAIYTIHYYDINYIYLFSITIDKKSCAKFN
jgi:hypothetical protein